MEYACFPRRQRRGRFARNSRSFVSVCISECYLFLPTDKRQTPPGFALPIDQARLRPHPRAGAERASAKEEVARESVDAPPTAGAAGGDRRQLRGVPSVGGVAA